MQLDQFVASSIKQIIDGVLDAQIYANEKGARINPFGMSISNGSSIAVVKGDYSAETGQIIDFDVAVTATEGSETKGGIGIAIATIGLGAQAKSDTTNSSVSRLKFSIPVFLPVQSQTKN